MVQTGSLEVHMDSETGWLPTYQFVTGQLQGFLSAGDLGAALACSAHIHLLHTLYTIGVSVKHGLHTRIGHKVNIRGE